MFASGIAVLVNQKHHAALSSVPFQSAAVVILIAGILSIIAGSVVVIAMKCRECPPAEAKKYLLIVSNWEASCWFLKLRIIITSQTVNNIKIKIVVVQLNCHVLPAPLITWVLLL